MAQIDKYEVIGEIGRGGMGAVYKALHPQFKKYVAIKEIRADLANDPQVQRRFEQEIEVLAQLPPHPNIVTVRDALVWEGKLYIVLDYIEGQNLSQQIRSAAISVERGELLLDRILSGLEAIHSRGIVHRDLKAGNILLDGDGNAFITDFGIAEFTNKETSAVVMATPRYSAPELIDPRLRGNGTDQQLDIYAAGILAYEMLLGEARFREAFPAVYGVERAGDKGNEAEKWLRWHLNLAQPATRLDLLNGEIPEDLARIIARMMAKDVKERYRTVKEVRRELAAMRQQREQQTRLQAMTFDQTIPLERPLGALTNLVGPDTAALYETQAIRNDEESRSSSSQAPMLADGAVTARPPRGEEPLELVTKESRPPATKDVATLHTGETTTAAPAGARWQVWAAGVAVVGLLAVAAWVFLLPKSFTLVVRGAPAGSTVFVDEREAGQTAADGTLRVADLAAGRRAVRVVRQGYRDFTATVEATGGEQVVLASLERAAAVNTGNGGVEIDYNGVMVLIAAGQFIFGDDRQQPDEGPSQRLTLPDFYIDKYEVTNAEYRKFCEATGRALPTVTKFNKDYFTNYPDKPVIGVSWHDAAAYAAWAGKRLPTEEEWEKAASWDPVAQKKRQYPWGDVADTGRATFGVAKKDLSPERLTVVGSYPNGASAYGVMDMAGNASEWVESYYQAYAGNQKPNPYFGVKYRVIRGGDVLSSMNDARTTRRQYAPPELKERIIVEEGPENGNDFNTGIGFRCAVPASDPRVQEALRRRQ